MPINRYPATAPINTLPLMRTSVASSRTSRTVLQAAKIDQSSNNGSPVPRWARGPNDQVSWEISVASPSNRYTLSIQCSTVGVIEKAPSRKTSTSSIRL